MHLYKSKWFCDVVAELKRQGFMPGGTAVPRLVSSHCRNWTTVEIRAGNTLRVLHPAAKLVRFCLSARPNVRCRLSPVFGSCSNNAFARY